MGSRHHSLDMSELKDVVDMLHGFEQHNKCRLEIRLQPTNEGRSPDLRLWLTAWPLGAEVPDLPSLGSVSVTCLAMNLRHWNAVLIHAMYALDFQLAVNELVAVEPKKA